MVARSTGVSGAVRHGSTTTSPRWPRCPRAAASVTASDSTVLKNMAARGTPAMAALWARTWLARRTASRSVADSPSRLAGTFAAIEPLYPSTALPPTSAIDGWRRFGDPRFRTYHYLALAQG